MRRLVFALLAFLVLLLPLTTSAGGAVTVTVGGVTAQGITDEAGRTLVPARFVSESLNAKVDWDPATRTVTITQAPTVILLTVGSEMARVNGSEVAMGTSAVMSADGRTMVPLRFIAEALGQKVTWDAAIRTVTLQDAALAEQGNQPGSSTNIGGYATRQGDWVYFTNFSDEGQLYRMRLDGTGVRRLTEDGFAFGMYAVGDWIYYISSAHGRNVLKRVKLDGTQGMALGLEQVSSFIVAGDWMYYIDTVNGNRVYRQRLDGGDSTRLNDLESQGLYLFGDWLYYKGNREDLDTLRRMRPDGTGDAKVLDGCCHLFMAGGNLYHQKPMSWVDRRFDLVRLAWDGSSMVTVAQDFSSMHVVNDDQWFYYADSKTWDGGPLMRMRTDGAVTQQLTPDWAAHLSLAGDWLLYENGHGSKRMYRIRTDGTGKSRLAGAVWVEEQ